ncbi:uncharacterized protein K452DRAFT_308420 [Aplosporella prunicola CBS 121167]|uniref:Uncharacterized protein n=1 Tax=Aplosporella prunicola CBS 121167 TaxID=1176127 RepID=A0A6A6BFK5_9PEZI|nr:uncharacterized protein K452DRAFT_308420 [Aplosporella prunicola CBS 121167]KAF2142014.1 hypothetical protein K452DRAFT_308420 [Aplosporella prunicola CBS 121167]
MAEKIWNNPLFIMRGSRSFSAWDAILRGHMQSASLAVLEQITGEARRPRRPYGRNIFHQDGRHTVEPPPIAKRMRYVLWHVKDEQAKRVLLRSVARDLLPCIVDKRSAKQMYGELVRRFGGSKQLSRCLSLEFYTWLDIMYDRFSTKNVDNTIGLWWNGIMECQDEGLCIPEPVQVAMFIRMFARHAPEWAQMMRQDNVGWEGVSLKALLGDANITTLRKEIEKTEIAMGLVERSLLAAELETEAPEREMAEIRVYDEEAPEGERPERGTGDCEGGAGE